VNPKTQAFLDKSRDSVLAAELLVREGYFDFAAGRAYYAIFYAAEALLLERGQSYSSHSAVIAAFGKEFAKTGALDSKFHRYLLDAQDFRNVGDYDVGGASLTKEQAQETIRWAKEFLEAANTFLK
jgi:uncharacterized protein (UPF0332 family)